MKNAIADWERIGSDTSYGRYASEIEKKTVLKANAFIKRPTTALDIGCEGGRWSKLLADTGWNLICTDIDPSSLAICQKRIPTATCKLVGPADSTLPCATESIKLALCVGVPQVIGAEWFIDEAFRVLQKGGLIAGVFWNRSSWRGLLYHSVPALRVKGSGQWYWFPQSYAVWKEHLCARGFTMVNEEGYGWPPFRRNSDSPIVPIATHIEHHLGLRKLARFSPLVIFIAQKV
ncbi:MAG: class I SAM-dependent methyltransferase [Ktedonobacteraceae bacterium]